MAVVSNVLVAVLLFAWAGAEVLLEPAMGKWRTRLVFFLSLIVISGVIYWSGYWWKS
ncbi:hypothetical protein QYF48_00655 [Brevibacillus agri]|uniref:hypothetical protein n=1 Tax=Brevibacillus agri TaxID=51101 RepID=UPI0025B67B99|nr:hypothetical protein [Brevibacillus agri]MDN4091329.1 hypothetical protein [Brevibacillus agri]